MLNNCTLVTCLKCGEVYFEVSREFAIDEVERFNKYFDSLPKNEQDDYYGGIKSKVSNYEFCWCKNIYTNFRDFKMGDCPDGVTISPIIKRDE